MKRVWVVRGLLVAGLVAVFAAFLLWPGGMVAASTEGSPTGRRELFVSFITLAVVGLALYGFDLREWL